MCCLALKAVPVIGLNQITRLTIFKKRRVWEEKLKLLFPISCNQQLHQLLERKFNLLSLCIKHPISLLNLQTLRIPLISRI